MAVVSDILIISRSPLLIGSFNSILPMIPGTTFTALAEQHVAQMARVEA